MAVKLKDMVRNAEKIFPRTFEQYTRYSLRLQGVKKYKTTKSAEFRAMIYGSPENKVYVMTMRYKAEDKTIRFKCSCPAERFFIKYANWRHGALYGNPDKWGRTPAKIRNPKSIPALCKHGLAFAYTLLQMGEIKG